MLPLRNTLLSYGLVSALALGLVAAPSSPLAAGEKITIQVEAPAALDAEHSLFAEVLTKVVYADGVDYAALYQDQAKLKAYLAQLAAATLPEGREAQLAFWINAYNAATLALVLETVPDPKGDAAKTWKNFSVMNSVDGFWKKFEFNIAGEWLNIDVMQKVKLAALGEARVHFAINCASVSCPALSAKAYTVENLEVQLDAAVRAFVADERQVAISKIGWTGSGRLVTLNPIMQWYAKDFGGDEKGVKTFLAKHAKNPEQAADLRKAELAYSAYDWSLNLSIPAQ